MAAKCESRVRLVQEGVARLGGRTTSTDLPVKNAWQETRGRGSEGFVVDIGSSYLFSTPELLLAKDGAAVIQTRAAESARGLQVTYRSSDPGKVLLWDGTTVAGELTAPLGQEVRAEGLTDAGEAEIAISAPGFLSTTTRVKLFPGALAAEIPAADLSTWSAPPRVSALWVAVDPATDRPVAPTPPAATSFQTRSGLRLGPVKWSSSDERVLHVVTTFPGASERTELVVTGAGESRIRAEAAGVPVWPTDGRVLRVARPSLTAIGALSLGKDLQRNLPITTQGLPVFTPQITIDGRPPVGTIQGSSSFQSQPGGTLTVRSEDPSKLLLSTGPFQPGTASLAIPLLSLSRPSFGPIWVQALSDDGEVRVVLSSPELSGEAITVVRLEPAKLKLRWGFFDSATQILEPSLQTVVASVAALTFRLESASGDSANNKSPLMGTPENKQD